MNNQYLWKKAQNILCVRLDNMGDVLMTTPAIRAVKESIPNAKITLLTSAMGEPIAKFIPEIDSIISFTVPWVRVTKRRKEDQSLQRLADVLRMHAFDAAILFTVYSQNPLPAALLCYMA